MYQELPTTKEKTQERNSHDLPALLSAEHLGFTGLIDAGHSAMNVASWMGDTVGMIEKVYKGFVQATRVAGRASVDSEWNSDAFELVQNAS